MTDIAPTDYAATLEHIKTLVHQSRYAAQRKIKTELLRLYWQIGDTLNNRQRTAAWGTNVVGQLADDLRTEFPSMRGFPRANPFYVRRVAEAWPDVDQFVQQAAGQIPWTHLTPILDRLDDPALLDSHDLPCPGGLERVVRFTKEAGQRIQYSRPRLGYVPSLLRRIAQELQKARLSVGCGESGIVVLIL